MSFALAFVVLLSPNQQKALKVLGAPLCARVKAAGLLLFHLFIATILLFVFPLFFVSFPEGSCLLKVSFLSCSELELRRVRGSGLSFLVAARGTGGEMAKDRLGRALAVNRLTVPRALLCKNKLPSIR